MILTISLNPFFKVFDYEEDTAKTTGKDTAQSPLSNGIFKTDRGCGKVRKIGLHKPRFPQEIIPYRLSARRGKNHPFRLPAQCIETPL
ncbi:hypothetical protein L950_0213840 [Sphingobacterium sp. IITKGP-BTPF85]|nr:hypothetical protein L950_0213840 [Sphingobacterium sp. IITKGP-BTPF85]